MALERLGPQRMRSVMVIDTTCKLGQMITQTSFYRNLRQALPQSRITAALSKGNPGLYSGNPYRISVQETDYYNLRANDLLSLMSHDSVICLPGSGCGYADLSGFLAETFDFEYPVRIGDQSTLSNILGGNAFAFSMSVPGFREKVGFTHSYPHPHGFPHTGRYVGEIFNLPLTAMGINAENFSPEMWMTDSDTAVAGRFFEKSGLSPEDHIIALNIGGASCRWDIEKYAELAGLISKDSVLGASKLLANFSRNEKGLYHRLIELTGLPVLPVPDGMSCGTLGALLAKTSYLFATDTGTAHIAQALGLAATVIYPDRLRMESWLYPDCSAGINPIFPQDEMAAGVNQISAAEAFESMKNHIILSGTL